MAKILTTSTAPLRVAALALVVAGLIVLILGLTGYGTVPVRNLAMVALVPLALAGMALQGLRR